MERSPRIEERKNFNAGRRAQKVQLQKSKKKGEQSSNPHLSPRKEAFKFTLAILVANATFLPTLLYTIHTFHLSDTVSVFVASWLGISIASVLKQWFPNQGSGFSKLLDLIVTRLTK